MSVSFADDRYTGDRVALGAALAAGRVRPLPRRVGVILSGGNIDAERFAELVTTGNTVG